MSSLESEKVVTITLDSNGFPVAVPESAQIKKDNQKVRWCSEYDFALTFDGGYSELTYNSGGNDCRYRCSSGTFGEIKKYKYSITINGKTTDPDVDVKP